MGKRIHDIDGKQMTVKEIAEMLGFDDPLYFSKKFRTYYGVSPSEYLESNT